VSLFKSHAHATEAPVPTNWTGVALGLCIGALAAFHQFKIPPAIPLLLDRYHYDLTVAGGFMSVYAAVGLAASALLGLGMQRFGLRRYVSLAATLFIVGSLITIAWPTFASVVLISRGIEGLGFAIFAVAGPVLAISSANDRHRPLAIAIYAAWIPLGQLVALGVAQPVIAAEEWRLIWWVGVALTVLLTAAVWRAGRHPKRDPSTIQPALRLRDVSQAQRVALYMSAALFALWSGQFFAMTTWLPHYLVEVRGISASAAMLPYAVPAVVVIIFNIVGGMLLRRGVPMFPLLSGALAVQGVLWLFFASFDSVWSGIAALAIFGAAAGITPTCLFSMPNTILGPRGSSGTAFGVIMTGRNLGVLVGPILLPQLMQLSGAWNEASPVFGVITLVAAAGAAGLGVMMFRIDSPAQ